MYKVVKILLLGLLLFFLGKEQLSAQFLADVGQEIGIVAGPLAFFSDYGSKNSLESEFSNIGIGIGLVHYLNFTLDRGFRKQHWFMDYFRIRSEIDYHWSTLKHHSRLAEKNNPEGQKLSSMIGISRVLEIGTHLEYHFFSIRDFTAFAYPFSPFISLGGNFVAYRPDVHSTLGPLEDHIFHQWDPNDVMIQRKTITTWALAFGAGTRYRVSASGDLVVNTQWRFYSTDWLDGFNHDSPQNRRNDTIFWFNFGYIYYLNF